MLLRTKPREKLDEVLALKAQKRKRNTTEKSLVLFGFALGLWGLGAYGLMVKQC